MNCQRCRQQFDWKERRPKVLPCGHTFCLKCLLAMPKKQCPVDNKVYSARPRRLVDNLSLLEVSQAKIVMPVSSGAVVPGLWCRSCQKDAGELCADEHSVCSVKKARLEGGHLEALQRAEAALDALAEAADAALAEAGRTDCRRGLQPEKDKLAAGRQRLQDALGAPPAAWELAKQAATVSGLSQSAAQLVAALASPSTTCSVTVRRGAGGGVAWRGEARPALDPAARLLLCQLACAGQLRQPDDQFPGEPRLQDVPAEGELAVEEMAARMAVGSRVARGRDWDERWTEDGSPPGPGTVTERGDIWVYVRWDRTGVTDGYNMGRTGRYQLRLLQPAPSV